jgi:glycerol-3-phosphate O-acyltransferase
MNKDSKDLDHIIPSIEDWPIRHFASNRDAFIQRLIDFTMEHLLKSNNTPLDLLKKTTYLERQRVKNSPWHVDPADEKVYWKSLTNEVDESIKASEPEKEQLKILRRLVHRYSEEIIGDFAPKTHLFARKFLTIFFKRLFNNGWGRGHSGIWGSKKQLLEKIKIDGHIDEIRTLFNKGTVVIVPTHYSNLDSIMLGFGIDMKLCIPAFSYGAGLNLYDYEILAYYMNRLGAYRVDRRKKNPIYLETLKSMASLSLIEGLNHIFFPGGTRSRSGAIEDKLKLGLLNSVIDAQRHCIVKDINQKIFIVPVVMGYHFVLEAGSLIDQHLKIIGREKYLRSRKTSSIFSSVFNFLSALRRNDSEVYLSFGQPMDVLGNAVDAEGNSFDDRGKMVNINKYFSTEDVPNEDTQRESVYTKILAEKIVKSFKEENIILSSHIAAFVGFNIIQEQNPEMDLFQILKIPVKSIRIKLDDYVAKLTYCLELLEKKKKKEKIKFSETLYLDPLECLKDGIKNVGVYHNSKVLKWLDKNTIGTDDLKLLYYYHNKMEHYDIQLNYHQSEDIAYQSL